MPENMDMAPPWENPPITMRVEGMPESISAFIKLWKYSRERRIPGSSCWDWMSLNWICDVGLVLCWEGDAELR